jgi:hypothetical protein
VEVLPNEQVKESESKYRMVMRHIRKALLQPKDTFPVPKGPIMSKYILGLYTGTTASAFHRVANAPFHTRHPRSERLCGQEDAHVQRDATGSVDGRSISTASPSSIGDSSDGRAGTVAGRRVYAADDA